MDSEIEELPTDFVRGLDFKITKTSKGGYADYSTSTWARRERALSELEQAAIKQYGLFSLKDFLPKKPGEVELKVIKEMFEASVDGEAFDMDRWGQYYKPAGMGGNTEDSVARSNNTKLESKAEHHEEDVAHEQEIKQEKPAAGSDASSRAADIIAMIRSRTKE